MDELRQHTEEEQQLIEREYQALINDYLSSNHRQKVEKIEKGWSHEQKYKVTDKNGQSFLLRITPMEQYEQKKATWTPSVLEIKEKEIMDILHCMYMIQHMVEQQHQIDFL